MWSPWRQKFTAFATFTPIGAESLVIIDAATVPELLDATYQVAQTTRRVPR